MPREVRCALVGCGRVAQKYAAFLTNGTLSHVKLTAVCDLAEEKASSLGKQFSARYFVDIHEMMRQAGDEIDLICILTESGYHASCVLELAKYKKDLLVEKPLGMNQSECAEMILAAEQNKIKLFVVKQNRYLAPVRKVKEALNAHLLGKIFLANIRMRWCRPQEYYDQAPWRGTKKLDGGVLTNQAIHYIDILQWYMGMPSSVYAEGFCFGAKIEMEDTAVAIFHFPNGAIGTLEATTACRPVDLEGSISLLGSKGAAEIRGRSLNQLESLYVEGKNIAHLHNSSTESTLGNGHIDYFKAAIQSILNDEKPEIDGVEGMKSVQILSALYESIRLGKRVFL